MRLLDYMKQNDLSDAGMAELVGADTTARAVKKWKYLETTPPLSKVLKIEELTNGAVSPSDFLSDVEVSPAADLPSDSPSTRPAPAAVPGAPGDVF